MVHGLLVFLLAFVQFVNAQNNEKLEICIANITTERCQFYGKFWMEDASFQIEDGDIKVIDDRTGLEANSITLPGKYHLNFERIIIKKDLNFLTADLRVELTDVPSFGSIPTVPSAIPLRTLPRDEILDYELRPARRNRYCDGASHQIFEDRSSYCRYCDLCYVSKEVEERLTNSSHKILPNLSQEGELGKNCTSFKANRFYRISRTIDLPTPDEAEKELPEIEASIKDAFEKGIGKMSVKLRILNKPHSRCGQGTTCIYFPWHPTCQCTRDREQCYRSDGQMQDAEMVGCVDITFNYKAKKFNSFTNRLECAGKNDESVGVTSPRNNNHTPVVSNTSNTAPWNNNNDNSVCNGKMWCCARSQNFIYKYNCPRDCVYLPETKCNFPSN